MPIHPPKPNRDYNDQTIFTVPTIGQTGAITGSEDVLIPGNWYEQETSIWLDIVAEHPELNGDTMAQLMFDYSLFEYGFLDGSEREGMFKAFEQYLWDEYGLDASEIIDWDDYREWYMSA